MKKISRISLLLVALFLTSIPISAHDFEVDGIYYRISTDSTVAVTYKGNTYPPSSKAYSGSVSIPSQITYSGTTYSVTSIRSAFDGCTGLTSITIPNSVTSIGSSSFYGCSGLTEIAIPNSVTTIDTYAFCDCNNLVTISIPNSVTSIGSNTFKNCSSLTNAIIGNSVATIGARAFYRCSKLGSISIPKSITKIGDEAFTDCKSLTNLIIEDGTDSLYLSSSTNGKCYIFENCPLKTIYMGRNITYLSEYASDAPFYDMKTLQKLTIGNSVTGIGNSAFYGCTGLTSVTIPNSVTSIGESAFYGCTGLTSVTIGNSVTSIGAFAFDACRGITSSITIPNSVIDIGRCAFRSCKSIECVIIGNGITILPEQLFSGCDNISTVYLGNSIKTISNKCFYGCSDLINIYLFSDNVTTLGTNAIPTTVSRIYVPDTKRYENLLNGYYTDNLITLNESTTEYNGKVPEFSYRNNVTGMNVSFNDSTTHIDAGSYNTNIDVIFSNENWSTQIAVPCSYNITKVPVTIIANDAKRQYGEENPEFSCSYFGFKNGETDSVLITRPTIATTATINSSVGSYPIIPTNAEAKNYTFTYERGILSITQASQSINWDQSFEKVFIGDQIELTAEATSGLAIKYSVSDESIAEIYTSNGKTYLDCIKNGEVILKANQSGNDNYLAADRVSKTIVINKISGVNNVDLDNNKIEVARYDIYGHRLSEPTKGINIVKYSDGTSRKEFVK